MVRTQKYQHMKSTTASKSTAITMDPACTPILEGTDPITIEIKNKTTREPITQRIQCASWHMLCVSTRGVSMRVVSMRASTRGVSTRESTRGVRESTCGVSVRESTRGGGVSIIGEGSTTTRVSSSFRSSSSRLCWFSRW